jgi:hypothetical protein
VVNHLGQCFEIAGIGQAVNIDQLDFGRTKQFPYHGGSDKTGPASHKDAMILNHVHRIIIPIVFVSLESGFGIAL